MLLWKQRSFFLSCFIFNCILSSILGENILRPDIPEYDLLEFLFKRYEKRVLPLADREKTLLVTFGMNIMQIIEVNGRYQYVKFKASVKQQWQNDYMRWDPLNWKNVSEIIVEPGSIWIPDIVLHNNADEEFPGGTEKYKTDIKINHDGTCTWNSPATFTSLCKINVRFFPFDRQECTMIFSSWTYNYEDIEIETNNLPLIDESYRKSTQWDVLDTSVKTQYKYYRGLGTPYSEILFKITILRKPLYYVFNVIMPCLVMILNIFIGFYLPPECGERVSLTITILLAVSVFLQLVTDNLPHNSESVPILAIFYIVIMMESVFSLMTTCIVLIIHYRGNEMNPPKMSKWIRSTFIEFLGKHLNIRRPNRKFEHREGLHNLNNKIEELRDKAFFGNINKVLPSCRERRLNNLKQPQNNDLAVLIEEVKNIRRDMASNVPSEEAEDLQEDWRYLAKILDRLFFRLLCFTVFMTTCGTMLPIYFMNFANK